MDLPIPDHATLSRRLQKLGEIRFRRLATDPPIHLLIDRTRLRIHVGDRVASVSADGAYILGCPEGEEL